MALSPWNVLHQVRLAQRLLAVTGALSTHFVAEVMPALKNRNGASATPVQCEFLLDNEQGSALLRHLCLEQRLAFVVEQAVQVETRRPVLFSDETR
jgi:hypothetical protein